MGMGVSSGEAASLSMNHNSAKRMVITRNPASEISTVEPVQPDLPFRLNGSQAKTARAIEINVDRMVKEAGLENVGFLTLTVGDQSDERFEQVRDAKEASRRINNLARRFLPSLFPRWVIVTERHKSGAIHFHLIVETREAIREAFDWEAVRAGDYSSACPALRRIWAVLRAELPKQGFGRAQLEPLKNGEAASRYVAKYVEKNLFNRTEEDRRKKLVRYGGWDKSHCRSNDISWATKRAAKWREKARDLAALVRADRATVAEAFGPRWSFKFTRFMHAFNEAGNRDRSQDLLPMIWQDGRWEMLERARQIVSRGASGKWNRAQEREEWLAGLPQPHASAQIGRSMMLL